MVDFSPGDSNIMERCKYCGKIVEKEGNWYCDKTCTRLFSSSSIRYIIEHLDHANAIDTFILVDFPLAMYNKFFSRNVKKIDFIKYYNAIISKNLPIEYKIIVAYYNASKHCRETYIPFSMVRSAVATSKMFRDISSHVNFNMKESLSIPERIQVEHDDFINELRQRNIIDDALKEKIVSIHEKLGMDRYMRRIGDGVATAYIIGTMAGARIKQDDVETITRRKMVTIRNLAVKIINEMKSEKKIILDGRFSSDIKNLSMAFTSES